MPPPVLRQWGCSRLSYILLGSLILAAVVATIVVDPLFAVAVLMLSLLTLFKGTSGLRMTEDELITGYPLSVRRIPRADVDYAKFEWRPLAVTLDIHLRSGEVVQVSMEPRFTSTELSGDPAQPGSAAYEITQWAKGFAA